MTSVFDTKAALHALNHLGWCRFPSDPVLADWVARTRETVLATLDDPQHAQWHRYDDTWFAGVNVLPNDPSGAVPDGPSLNGIAKTFIDEELSFGLLSLDRAQVSVCRPGYPQPMTGESEAIFAFRRDRDAAHIDGLLKEGPQRRRFLREYHAYILGIPITDHDPGAAPFSIWEGSQHIIGKWLRETLCGLPKDQWEHVDLTDGYQAARKQVFENCRRVEVPARPGQAYLVHRHAVHGMARWQEGAKAGPDGRAIVYFRPAVTDKTAWLGECNPSCFSGKDAVHSLRSGE